MSVEGLEIYLIKNFLFKYNSNIIHFNYNNISPFLKFSMIIADFFCGDELLLNIYF